MAYAYSSEFQLDQPSPVKHKKKPCAKTTGCHEPRNGPILLPLPLHYHYFLWVQLAPGKENVPPVGLPSGLVLCILSLEGETNMFWQITYNLCWGKLLSGHFLLFYFLFIIIYTHHTYHTYIPKFILFLSHSCLLFHNLNARVVFQLRALSELVLCHLTIEPYVYV